MFGQLQTYTAAEALATRIAAGPVYAALAVLLLEAPGCSLVLLGLLVQLTFSSVAASRLTAVNVTSTPPAPPASSPPVNVHPLPSYGPSSGHTRCAVMAYMHDSAASRAWRPCVLHARVSCISSHGTAGKPLQGGDSLGDVLCGMLRVLRSLPHAVAVALLQSVVNIGRGPRGVVWLQESGFTLATAVRLARNFTVPTAHPPQRHAATPRAELCSVSGNPPCAVEPGQAGVCAAAKVLRPLRSAPGGGAPAMCGAADAAGGGGGAAMGDAGATAGALRLEGLLRQVRDHEFACCMHVCSVRAHRECTLRDTGTGASGP